METKIGKKQVRHYLNIYKYMPDFPTPNDVLYHFRDKQSFNKKDVDDLSDKAHESLEILVNMGCVNKISDDKYKIITQLI